MKLSKEEELLALGAALYLVGLEVEACRGRLEELFDQGVPLSAPETLAANAEFNKLSWKFTRLEEEYLLLEQKA